MYDVEGVLATTILSQPILGDQREERGPEQDRVPLATIVHTSRVQRNRLSGQAPWTGDRKDAQRPSMDERHRLGQGFLFTTEHR